MQTDIDRKVEVKLQVEARLQSDHGPDAMDDWFENIFGDGEIRIQIAITTTLIMYTVLLRVYAIIHTLLIRQDVDGPLFLDRIPKPKSQIVHLLNPKNLNPNKLI